MGIALALNGGVERSLFTWLPYFAAQLFESSTANLLLTAYLLAYIPGRLTYSYVADRIDLSLDLVLLLVVCTVPLLLPRGVRRAGLTGVLGDRTTGICHLQAVPDAVDLRVTIVPNNYSGLVKHQRPAVRTSESLSFHLSSVLRHPWSVSNRR